MVIKHGQGVAATVRQRKMAFEIHLPEIVRLLFLESFEPAWMLFPCNVQLAVAPENLRDRAERRDVHKTLALHHMRDFAGTPRTVAVLPHSKHFLLRCRAGTRWAA